MIEPYQAVGLIQTMRGIRRREEIEWNLDHIAHISRPRPGCRAWTFRSGWYASPKGGCRVSPTRSSTWITKNMHVSAR